MRNLLWRTSVFCEKLYVQTWHCPYKLHDQGAVTSFLVTEGLLGYIYLVIYCHMASYGLRKKTGAYRWRGWVIPLRLLWQLEHLWCKQTALHGGGDALFGNRRTRQPVFAETLRVDDDLSHNVKIVSFDNIRLHTFGLTMYCPGFTVTSLQTSLVLHGGSWDVLHFLARPPSGLLCLLFFLKSPL